jgi:glycosyltransferase involved in cell wall biosynthesis
MVNVNFVGGVFGSSGYSCHCKGLAEALIKQGTKLHIESPLPTGWEVMVSDNLLKAIKQPKFEISDDPITLYVGLPNSWPVVETLPNRGFYGYVIWEGTYLPTSFIEPLKNSSAKGIIVPSLHVKQLIVNTLPELESKIYVVPHGIDINLFNPKNITKPTVFTFVANKGFAQGIYDRGGVQFLLKAFCEEFRKSEQVRLNLKINPSYCAPGWNLNDEIAKLNLPTDHAEFGVCMDDVQYAELIRAYQGHVFVSPTMGEAFSLPCAEAMACGLPVITTNFGGQIDFVNNENGWLAPYSLVPVIHDVMYEDASWAMPDISELRKILRSAYELWRDQPMEYHKKCWKAYQDIRPFTWDNSAKHILKMVEQTIK